MASAGKASERRNKQKKDSQGADRNGKTGGAIKEIESLGETKRFSLDLSPERHAALRMYALTHDVRAAEVLRAAFELIESDEEVSERVLEIVRENR